MANRSEYVETTLKPDALAFRDAITASSDTSTSGFNISPVFRRTCAPGGRVQGVSGTAFWRLNFLDSESVERKAGTIIVVAFF